MFYGKGSDEPLFYLRKMIMSKTTQEREKALAELAPFVKKAIKGTLEAMDGMPVVIRLLDPPLHEFVPQDDGKRKELAKALNLNMNDLVKRFDSLHEVNPMMGHRGVRLGVTFPEITEMQVRAIYEAAAELTQKGKKPYPEIMIPVTCDVNELKDQYAIVAKVYKEVLAKYKLKKLKTLTGTMIEIPRATLLADQFAEVAEFFSFGTNDLTQMTFGFSRDDTGGFRQVRRKGRPRRRSVPEHRRQRRRRADSRRHRTRPSHQPGPGNRHLRRTRRRPRQRRVLLQGRHGLRQLLAVPRAHRTSGRRAGRCQVRLYLQRQVRHKSQGQKEIRFAL